MPQGLEIYDASGTLVAGINTRLSRLIATINPGIVDGSQSFPGLGNALVAILADYAQPQNNGFRGGYPTVSVSGTTVSWTFDLESKYREYTRIFVFGY